MKRPDYLSKYRFDWELLETVIGGKSAIDADFLGRLREQDDVELFLKGYGIESHNPVVKAELFGNFQEAMQFIRRYFIPEAAECGIRLNLPESFYTIIDIADLFMVKQREGATAEEVIWAEIILKVMHTILHIDKDLRGHYFSSVQTQVFDRFYKYLHRDQNNQLLLGSSKTDPMAIQLADFQTKSKKPRDSVIIKLLHKEENVSEVLFDRIGLRFVTNNRVDVMRVIRFLIEKNVVIPHNVKPSRAINSLIDMKRFKEEYSLLVKAALKTELPEEEFIARLETAALEAKGEEVDSDRNRHSLKEYRSIQFTCRQMVKIVNPFIQQFHKVRDLAKGYDPNHELAKKVLSLDVSQLAGDMKFFYPFEIQIVDEETNEVNSKGEAGHQKYKKKQLKSAMVRLFRKLFVLKGVDPDLLYKN